MKFIIHSNLERLHLWSLRMDFIPHFIMDVINHPCWDWSQAMSLKGTLGLWGILPPPNSILFQGNRNIPWCTWKTMLAYNVWEIVPFRHTLIRFRLHIQEQMKWNLTALYLITFHRGTPHGNTEFHLPIPRTRFFNGSEVLHWKLACVH